MGKNILVLTGSPRKGGNSDTLADAFIEGARSKGHDAARFETAVKTVQGCRACNACWSKGDACIFDDGFRELAPLLVKADVLVLATPLYFYGFASQIKAAIDKFYSFMVPHAKQKLKLKEAVLLMTAEEDRQEAFAGSVGTYKSICEYLELADRGMITVQGVNAKGEIAGNASLEQARALGASM